MEGLNWKPGIKIIGIFFLVFVVVLLFLPKTPKFNYEYNKGLPWKYEALIAQFDFPIYKTDEQLAADKSSSECTIIPYFKCSEEVEDKCIKAAEGLELGGNHAVKAKLISSLRAVYKVGILPDEMLPRRKSSSYSKEVIYVQRDKKASKYPVSELFLLSAAKAKVVTDVCQAFPSTNVDSLFKEEGVIELLAPNLSFDSKTTDLIVTEHSEDVPLTKGFVPAGTLIVSKDEIVTADILQTLNSYKWEFENNVGSAHPSFARWLGYVLTALAFVLLLFLVIFFTNRQLFEQKNLFYYLLFIYMLAMALIFVSFKLIPAYIMMVPFPLIALYLQAFFKNRLVVIVYMISLIPMLLVTGNNPAYYILFLLSGLAYVFVFKKFSRSWMQFVSAFLVFVVAALTYTGFVLCDVVVDIAYGWTLLHIFISSLLCVFCYPLVYVFEIVFNLISSTRLEELADSNGPLVRKLNDEAPGTYQHSLNVQNMADAVARSIDANVPLVRAAAIYHDIGKLDNPRAYTENESILRKEGEASFHDNLSFKESAKILISHVESGLRIAKEYKLPSVLREFIITHHGTSRVNYFYTKFVNAGGDPAEVDDFKYQGRKPSTREQVILMLCDAVEAASRSLSDNSSKTRSSLVHDIISQKFSEGQFVEADISLKDLNAIADCLNAYLAQLYHERVAYPKRLRKAPGDDNSIKFK